MLSVDSIYQRPSLVLEGEVSRGKRKKGYPPLTFYESLELQNLKCSRLGGVFIYSFCDFTFHTALMIIQSGRNFLVQDLILLTGIVYRKFSLVVH